MKKKAKTSRTATRVPKSGVKKKAAKRSAAARAKPKPQGVLRAGAVVMRLNTQQVRLLTGTTLRDFDVVVEKYREFRTPVGCGTGSPTSPWILYPVGFEFEGPDPEPVQGTDAV